MKINNTTTQAVSSGEMPTYKAELSLGAKILQKMGFKGSSSKMIDRQVTVKKEGDAADDCCVACCVGAAVGAAVAAPRPVYYRPAHYRYPYHHHRRW